MPAVRPVELTFRPLANREAVRAGIPFPASGLFVLPAQVAGLALPDALRAAITGQGAPEAGGELAFEFEIGGERFRTWRCWPGEHPAGRHRGEDDARNVLALLGRPTGPEITKMEVVAEGPERVSAEVQRLIGPWHGPVGVVVAPWSRLARLIASSPDAARGVAHGVFALLSGEIESVSRGMGGRIRELLLAAHDLLRTATEALAPDQADVLTPDDLVSRRDDLAAGLEEAVAASERLVDAAVAARKLAAEARRRKDLADGYLEAEDSLRKLELLAPAREEKHRRLERARRAARLAETLGLRVKAPEPPRVDPRARENAERALERARAETAAARRVLDAEEARTREHDALRDWIGRLEGLVVPVGRIEEARAAIQAADEAHATAEAGHARARRDLDSVEQRVERLEAERSVLSEGPANLEVLREELRVAQRLRDDVKRLAAVRERLRDEARDSQVAKLLVDEADEAIEAARSEMDYRARSPIAGPRQELAAALTDLVSRREELAADAARRAGILAVVREELRGLTTSLGASAYKEPVLLEAAAREREEALSQWGTSARSLAEIEAELAELGRRGVELAREVETRAADFERAAMQRLRARGSLREREAAVPENLRARQDLDAAIDMARADLAVRLEALAEARAAARRADDVVTACEADLRAAQDAERRPRGSDRRGAELVRIRDGGFESIEDFERARLAGQEMTQLEREIAEHDEAVRAAGERLRHGQDQALLPRQDPDQVDLMADIVEHARDEAQAAEASLSQEIALIEGWLDGLDDISARLSTLEESAGLGRRGDARPGATFERRVHESLMRALLARAEGRLARWQRPWTLAWREGDDDDGRHLEVQDTETEEAVDLAGRGATLLALSLALEAAVLVQERRRPRLETILLDAVPGNLAQDALGHVVAGLAEVAREHPVGVPADAAMRELLLARL